MNLKINSKNIVNSNKWVLREILYKYVPKHLIKSKSWICNSTCRLVRGPLKTWAGDLLSKDNTIKDGYFKPFEISLYGKNICPLKKIIVVNYGQ